MPIVDDLLDEPSWKDPGPFQPQYLRHSLLWFDLSQQSQKFLGAQHHTALPKEV